MYDDPVDELERALDKVVTQKFGKSFDDIYDELDDTTKDQAERYAHVQEELDELREALADLQEVCADHDARAEVMAAELRQTRRQARPVQKSLPAPSGGSTGFEDLAKALQPGASPGTHARLATLLKAYAEATEARVVRYDRDHAARLRQVHGANVLDKARTMQDLSIWQETSLLPARYDDPAPLAKAVPFAMSPQFGGTPVEAPEPLASGPALRKALQAYVGAGKAGRYDAEVAADLVQRGGLSVGEATAWKRSGRLALAKALTDDVQIPPVLGPAKAALCLTPVELGKTPATKVGHGHWTPQRSAAQRAQDLARLAQMAR
jgi:hypothetical protein